MYSVASIDPKYRKISNLTLNLYILDIPASPEIITILNLNLHSLCRQSSFPKRQH